jgi:hypothetical protein
VFAASVEPFFDNIGPRLPSHLWVGHGSFQGISCHPRLWNITGEPPNGAGYTAKSVMCLRRRHLDPKRRARPTANGCALAPRGACTGTELGPKDSAGEPATDHVMQGCLDKKI